MDKIPRFGENKTLAKPIEITKSRQIIKMETLPRLRTREKYARCKVRLRGGSKTDTAFRNLIQGIY